jgi:hypothetical protein
VEIAIQEQRSLPSRTGRDRREGDRRSAGDRRQEAIDVPAERRTTSRRFIERRAEMGRRVNDRHHLLT